MNRFLSFLFACGAMSVFAAVTPVKHGEVNYIVENGKVVITGLSSRLVTDLIIPEKIGSLPVTKIAADAFELGERLISVTIPATVTEIGEYAFKGCDQLEAVYISDLAAWCKIDFANEFANPLSIAGTLYVGSEVVTSVTIPSTLNQVKPFTFVGCQTLKSVEIASGVTEIGESAFEGCGALETFKLPATVTTVGESAFAICDSLVEVTLPEGVKTVEDYAFLGCAGLTDVTLPVSLTEMGDAAFLSAAPESLTGPYLPSGMSPKNLTLVVVPEGITALSEDAFAECEALTTVKMPSTVKTIGDRAFGGCFDLEQLSIPSSTTQIGEYAFYGVALTSVRISAGVKTISEGAFYYCPNLTSVVIRNGVEQIEASAFEGCGKLAEVELPASVTSVGRYAFIDTAPAKMKFKGVPPTTVGANAFDATNGYYANNSAKAWNAVIQNGKWNGLTMSAYTAGNEPAEVTTQINVVQVIFDANGGSGSKVSKRIVGTALTAPTAPIRDGYTFKGWTPAVPKTVPAANATYIAQWEQKPVEIKKYLITFDANGGIGSQKSQQVEGAKLEVPTVTREGYTFKGWIPAVSENEKVPSKDTTYKAQWQVNQYTITFNANGGAGGETRTQDYGTSLVPPMVTRKDYTFTGWSPAVPKTVPATNATYTAQWKLTTVDILSLDVTENAKKKQATIKGCNQQISGYLEIPQEINGNTVVAIADGAFKGETKLTKVTLPNTITSIGKDAFKDCVNLDVNAIIMPNQPKLKVGKGAFTGCKVTEVSAVPGEPLTSAQLGKAVGYKAATTASGLKVNAKTGDITATFKKSGTYEAVLFKPGASLKAIRIKVGDMPKLTIKMDGADAGCSVKGAGEYLMGKKVSLSAKASKEKIFLGFYDAQGKQLTSAMKYPYVMGREDVTFTAKFTVEDITIDTSALTSKTWQVGETVNVTIPVTAESGVKSVKAAKLPSGLKLSKTKDNRWQVTGSPKKVGDYTVTFTVGTVQKKQKTVTITMMVIAETVTINTSAVKNKTLNVGQAVRGLTIGASSTSGIKSVKASKLPSGMKVQLVNGVWQLTGAPKKAGTYTVTLTITTKANTKVTETFTLTVALIPEWAVKTYVGEVVNVWEDDDGEVETWGTAQVTLHATGEVEGNISLDDGLFASLSGTAKLLESSTNKVRLQVTVPWFDPDGKADGKVKTELIINNNNGTITLDYRDSTKDSYVTGRLNAVK